MKQLFCVLILLTSVFAGDLKLVEFSDQAYGTKGWKVVNVPKTKDKGRVTYWAEWKMEPVIIQSQSGEVRVSMGVRITAAGNKLSGATSTMPDAVDLRIDDNLTTVADLRRTHNDMWVNGRNYGTTSVEWSVRDPVLLQRIANSKDAWMIGYTRFGNQDRRNVEIPASWKQAISLILSQYDKMTLNRVKEPEASPPQPTAHGTIGASSDDNPRVRHDAPMAEPEASTSQPTAHGTIGVSSDGNPSVRHDGVTVSQVVTGGPADQIGIKVGDVILAIDDHYLYTIEELNNATGRCKPGSTIKIRYRRYSMTYEMSLIVGVGEVAKTEHNSP